MKIGYSLTFGEVWPWFFAYQRHQHRVHPPVLYVQWALITVLVCLVTYCAWDSHVVPMIFGRSDLPFNGSTLMAPFIGLLAPVFTWWFFMRHVTIFLDPKQIVIKHPAIEAIDVPWRSVNLLEEDSAYIVIGAKLSWLRSPYYIVPKRAFTSNQEAQAFFDQADNYWSEAVGRSVEASGAWPPAPTKPKG